MDIAIAGMELHDVDIWWFVCRLCHRAYAEDTQDTPAPLRAIRVHVWTAHGSRDTANVRILSQSADLEPRVKIVSLLSQVPKTANGDRTRRGYVQRAGTLPNHEAIARHDHDLDSVRFKSKFKEKGKTNKTRQMKNSSRRRRGRAGDHEEAILSALPEDERFGLPENPEPLGRRVCVLIKEEVEVPDADTPEQDPYSPSQSNWLADDPDWEPEPDFETETETERIEEEEEDALYLPLPANANEEGSSSTPKSNDDSEHVDNTHSQNNVINVARRASTKSTNRRDCHVCHICAMTFAFKHTLTKHLCRVHASELGQKLLRCPVCQRVCASKKGLRLHKKAAHSATAAGAGKARDSNQCSVCLRVCASREILLVHEQTHNAREILCPDCGVLFKSEWTLRQHQKLIHSSALPFKCSKCGAAFKRLMSLKRHAAAHVKGRPFLCSQCPNTFRTEIHLKDHVWVKHKHPKKTNVCRVCKKVFKGKTTLRSHEFEVHDYQRGGTRYKCPFCPRQFWEEYCLRLHLPKHSSERPFKCEHLGCGKTYKFAFHLKDHATIHLAYEDLPRVCDMCEQRFGTTQQVRDHKRKVHGLTLERKPKPTPPLQTACTVHNPSSPMGIFADR